jgi:predicted aspartyl protease
MAALKKSLFPAFLLYALINQHAVFGQTVRDKMDITFSNNDLFIKVFINDKGPYNFVYDTGASGIGRVDERIVKELNLPVIDSTKNYDGSGNFKMVPVIGVDEVRVGEKIVKNVTLLSRNYNVNPAKDKLLTDGIIGRDFFADYLLTIDGPNQILTFSSDSLDRLADGVLTYQQPFVVKGKVGKIDTHFHIDTGSNLSMHFPKTVIEKLRYTDTARKSIARKANSEYIIQETVLHEKLLLSLVKAENLLLNYSEKATYINVGMKFLKNYKLIIDQKNRLLKIE